MALPRSFAVQGLKCGVINDMISTGLGFWSYELGQTFYRNAHDGRSPGPRDRGFIGAFSALCVMTATLPLEVVLRRLQVLFPTLAKIQFSFCCAKFPA